MSAPPGAEPSAQPGHCFAVRGDLTRLTCDAIVVPTSQDLQVTSHWSSVVPTRAGRPSPSGWLDVDTPRPDGWGETDRCLRVPDDGRGRQVWLVRTDGVGKDGQWVADGLVQAVERAAEALGPPDRRAARLVGVPLAGTGTGGLARRRGEVVEALVPALVDVARRIGVDVALVLADDQDHAAVQARRSRLPGGPGTDLLASEALASADRLGDLAASGHLVPFLGAGVSLAAGLPSWPQLLAELAAEAGLAEVGLETLDPRDAAELTYRGLGFDAFADFMTRRFTLHGHALAHALVAGLRAESVVTTNYDSGYELAAGAVHPADRPLRVLPFEHAEAGSPWLLKMHGDIARPQSIVLTRAHYVEYDGGSAPLTGLVQAMLLTRHVLFVGFSLEDDNFARLAHQVRQVLRQAEPAERKVGTVLALQDQPARRLLWTSDLDWVAMTAAPGQDEKPPPLEPAARLLEVFLDRLAWRAATTRSGSEAFLLDPRYDALERPPADERLRERLVALLAGVTSEERRSPAWRALGEALEALGAPRGR